MSELNPKIIATTPEEFKRISDKLAILPECVRSQIETAESGIVGITCDLRYNFKSKQVIYLPKTTQINDFGDYIGCYCGEFFIRLGKDIKKNPIEYIFVENLPNK